MWDNVRKKNIYYIITPNNTMLVTLGFRFLLFKFIFVQRLVFFFSFPFTNDMLFFPFYIPTYIFTQIHLEVLE